MGFVKRPVAGAAGEAASTGRANGVLLMWVRTDIEQMPGDCKKKLCFWLPIVWPHAARSPSIGRLRWAGAGGRKGTAGVRRLDGSVQLAKALG